MNRYSPFAVILFFFLSLFLYTKFAGPIPFSVNSVQTTKTDLFRVSGVGEASATPNMAIIPFGVTKTASTAKEAQDQANAVMNTIVKDLKALGVEEKDIKTISYAVYPQYDQSSSLGGKQKIQTYMVGIEVEVHLSSIEKANKATDIAVNDGANNIIGLRFVLDEKTQQELKEKARKIAIQNAKEEAQSLANAAGIKLGRIVDVQESNQAFVYQKLASESSDIPAQNTHLLPGQNNISISVTLSYETN